MDERDGVCGRLREGHVDADPRVQLGLALDRLGARLPACVQQLAGRRRRRHQRRLRHAPGRHRHLHAGELRARYERRPLATRNGSALLYYSYILLPYSGQLVRVGRFGLVCAEQHVLRPRSPELHARVHQSGACI